MLSLFLFLSSITVISIQFPSVVITSPMSASDACFNSARYNLHITMTKVQENFYEYKNIRSVNAA